MKNQLPINADRHLLSAAIFGLSLACSALTATPTLAEPQDGGAVVDSAATGAVRSIGLPPRNGPLGEALATEFRNRGYTIVNVTDPTSATGLAPLRAQGVDAILIVRTAGGSESCPQAASAQISSTATGQVLAKMTWQNGWGGWRGAKGAPSNRVMRKSLTQAAREIADELVRIPL
jgi:hypothetical protein